jgi:hypothetical protein
MIRAMNETDGFFDAIRKGNAVEVARLLDGNPALARPPSPRAGADAAARSDAGKTLTELASEREDGAVADILRHR